MPDKARFSRTLTILCGLQGTGKSEAAKIIAKKQRALLLKTDEISKKVVGEPTYTEQGIFTDEYVEKRYCELLRMIAEVLKRDKNVVADATFDKRKNRERARQIASAAEVDFQIIQVICPEELVEERMETRKDDASQATFIHHLVYKDKFEPFVAEEMPICIFSNASTLEDLEIQVNMFY